MLGGVIAITNTHSVGVVRDALVAHAARANQGKGSFWSLPVVGETYDGALNDIDGFHVRAEHVDAALAAAAGGPVAEGNVGGGTGMNLFGFKGGIGTSSRTLSIGDQRWTLGVLVQGNFGAPWQLLVDGVPVGREFIREGWTRDGAPVQQTDGSCIVVIATDAPLSAQQLERVCRRGMLGLAQTGSMAHNGSGELLIAFSNAPANRFALDNEAVLLHETRLSDEWIDPIFDMTVETTTEAVLNAMLAAETMTGRDGHTVHALPHDRLRDIMRRHGRLRE
jgi:L-aminopeptidase/D-esterase-like protein